MIATRHLMIAALAAGLSTSCGGDKKGESPGAAGSTALAASASAAALPEAPPSMFSVVLESSGEITFSGLEGGVFVADAARGRYARALGSEDLVSKPMPEGLPSGQGKILQVSGRLPGAVWLSFETLKDDGTPDTNPLYRLTKDAWKQFAVDWKPQIAVWSKNRILAASTSSTRLKLKVIEPSLPAPPDDLPSARINDESCAKTLQVRGLVALESGEVFAAGDCKPDVGAGAGASGTRYVVIRWIPDPPAPKPADSPHSPPEDAGSADAGSADAGSADAGDPPDGGAAPEGKPGIVDVMPGVSKSLAHRALHAQGPSDVYAAAVEDDGKGGLVSHVMHFDGATWGVEPLPRAAGAIRGLSGTSDGTLWMVTDHAIFTRPPSGAWAEVPPPNAAFPEASPTWEYLQVFGAGADDVWIAARHVSAKARRDVVLRRKKAKEAVRW